MTNLMNLNTTMCMFMRVGRTFPFHFPLTFTCILRSQDFLKFAYLFKQQGPKYGHLNKF